MKEIFVKDESTRFNLKAFKVLGGSYAAACLVACELGISPDNIDFPTLAGDETRDRIGRITLAAATDGNHGRGIAWAAEQLGLEAVIYMPKDAALSWVENIRELKEDLAIDSDSTLLFFNTEGATDPENYREIVWHGKYPSLF